MDNVEIKKSNLEAAYKQADDNTKKLLATLFGDAVTAKDDRPVTERIKTFEDAMAALDSNHPFVCDFRAFCAQSALVKSGADYAGEPQTPHNLRRS